MDSENNIPKEFHSDISEKPFENCIVCEKFLLDEGTEYLIEKTYKDKLVEVEYAICFECAENMQGNMSEDSMNNIKAYFEENQLQIMENLSDGISPEILLGKCMIKGTSVSEMNEYQIAGAFSGKKLMMEPFPFVMSFEVTSEINELLSAKTKDEIDGFIDDFIGVPPEWLEIIKNNKPIFI